MPKYSFNCSECLDAKSFNFTIKEYNSIKNTISCDRCDKIMNRMYNNFNYKVIKSSAEIAEDIVKEKEKIIDKVNSGDIRTITDIYGE